MAGLRLQAGHCCDIVGCLAATTLGFVASAGGWPGGLFVAIGIGSLVASYCIAHAWARCPERLREAAAASGGLALLAMGPALFSWFS